jgi:hypothetical protein
VGHIPVNEEVKQRILEKERAHFNSLPEKDRLYYQAFRQALIKSTEESWNDKNNWWNKISTMS